MAIGDLIAGIILFFLGLSIGAFVSGMITWAVIAGRSQKLLVNKFLIAKLNHEDYLEFQKISKYEVGETNRFLSIRLQPHDMIEYFRIIGVIAKKENE